jgi:hypothetical protein
MLAVSKIFQSIIRPEKPSYYSRAYLIALKKSNIQMLLRVGKIKTGAEQKKIDIN